MQRIAGQSRLLGASPGVSVVGDIGDVVAVCTHPTSKNRVYILKIGIYHAPMDEKGIELLPAKKGVNGGNAKGHVATWPAPSGPARSTKSRP